MSASRKVTISRKWHQPKIETTLSDEAIKLEMPLDDFLKALRLELSWRGWMLSDVAFTKAVETVLEGIKEESAKVVR